MPLPQFEIFKDNAGKFRWRLKASNREIIVVGESFSSKAEAENSIDTVKKYSGKAAIRDLTMAHAAPLGQKIILNYAGRCLKCGRIIPEASEAFWAKGQGVWHIDCGIVRKSRKPNTRILALASVLVISTLILGFSLGVLSGIWPIDPPIIRNWSVTTTSTQTSISSLQSITSAASTRKWVSSDDNVISYLDAKRFLGQTKTVEGKIVRTNRYDPGNVIFLNFHDPYQGYFTVIIWREYWKNFPSSPEVFYRGKEVRVTGRIYDYQGSPQIELTSPRQIEVAYLGFNYPVLVSAFWILAITTRNTAPQRLRQAPLRAP